MTTASSTHELSIKDSSFLRFEECPKCHIPGRNKVFAVFSDGHGYCFWCEYYKPAESIFEKIHKIPVTSQSASVITDGGYKFKGVPDGTGLPIGVEALEWLKKYGITNKELMENTIEWNETLKWLVFQFKQNDKLIGWQCRRFKNYDWEAESPHRKWLTFGPKSEWCYYVGLKNLERNGIIVLVEDIISAIKVGRSFTAMPLFGSTVALKQLASLGEKSKQVGIWLDRDKARESYQAAARVSQFAPKAISIVTEKDPKDYSDTEIVTRVCDAFPGTVVVPF